MFFIVKKTFLVMATLLLASRSSSTNDVQVFFEMGDLELLLLYVYNLKWNQFFTAT